jgi:hypothetical protein
LLGLGAEELTRAIVDWAIVDSLRKATFVMAHATRGLMWVHRPS